ncbi:MAG: metal-dependent transcriptional regulator [Anaerolineae bacterium]|nr:metal-dependent transcriptional regulator [Anaerolineae bacterium]
MISSQMEEYIEAIVRLQERGEPVTTSALAHECQVAPPTVTEMLRRLSEHGLVSYEPRREPSLTPAGRSLGSSVLRRHRLWERFLHDVLRLPWDRLHDQACELEHATSPELERLLAEALGESDTCPHGRAIPGQGADVAQPYLVPLSELRPSWTGRIVSISQEDEALLRHRPGIRPGAVVEVNERAEPGDPLAFVVGGRRELLPRDLASRITARVLSPEQAGEGEDRIPLSALPSGETGIIRGFKAGRGLVSRCLALGFTPGTAVKMIQNSGHGPVIVLVRDTRVALGRGEAQKVLVVRGGGACASTC